METIAKKLRQTLKQSIHILCRGGKLPRALGRQGRPSLWSFRLSPMELFVRTISRLRICAECAQSCRAAANPFVRNRRPEIREPPGGPTHYGSPAVRKDGSRGGRRTDSADSESGHPSQRYPAGLSCGCPRFVRHEKQTNRIAPFAAGTLSLRTYIVRNLLSIQDRDISLVRLDSMIRGDVKSLS